MTSATQSISAADPEGIGPIDAAAEAYSAQRVAHWDGVAKRSRPDRRTGRAYHRRLVTVYRHLVAPGLKVLEIGCGEGDLLAAAEPSVGVGVDFSPEMVRRARERHPGLRFVQADAHHLELDETPDVIILSDLINDLWDVQRVLERLRPLCTPRTRLILNFYSHLWQAPLRSAQRLGLAQPVLEQNWLVLHDVANLLNLAGFEMIRHWEEVLWPVTTPLVEPACNKYLVRLWPFRHAALSNFVVARPQTRPDEPRHRVSVIVPARNEAGNIEPIILRTPELGAGMELIFVEGHSTDGTWDVIQREVANNPGRDIKALRQSGRGKGDAVRLGFSRASGDVLMILDADMTVPPEDLTRFYDALCQGRGEFINGVRLVYPMEKKAMRLINLAGNKFFSLAFSWLLGQPVKDTLCGTKVMWKKDYELLAANRSYFGDFDPFGDFDLLFGAAKMNLEIVDMPIRYRDRTYGTTNIRRWKHGWLLIKMTAFAARRIKFV